MTLEELIAQYRAMARDTADPPAATDEQVTYWLNEAQEEAAIRGRLLYEDQDPELCEVELETGTHTYQLHPAIYEITLARVVSASGSSRRLSLVSAEWLDAQCPDWRDADRTMNYAIQRDTTIRIAGTVETGDKLVLEGYRLPLTALDGDDDEPEIHKTHHRHLLQWVLYRVFSIPELEVFDANKAKEAEDLFRRYFGDRVTSDLRRTTRHDVPHHNVAILP